jgi:hypothetical protein
VVIIALIVVPLAVPLAMRATGVRPPLPLTSAQPAVTTVKYATSTQDSAPSAPLAT